MFDRSGRSGQRVIRGDSKNLAGGCRVCHCSVQRNHIRLIVAPPAGNDGSGVEKALGKAVHRLAIRIARTLNGAPGRRRGAFPTAIPRASSRARSRVKRALTGVIDNGRKHPLQAGEGTLPGWSNPCSAAFVSVWLRTSQRLPAFRAPAAGDPVAAPRTWLLRTGWHDQHGGLDAFASPKSF